MARTPLRRKQVDVLTRASMIADELADIIGKRDAVVVEARDAGHTWREIAIAVGMTEMGVKKIYERTTAAATV